MKGVRYSLDLCDRDIIRALQCNGRVSNVDIARRVGVSEATVRKRLARLIDQGTIRVTAVPDSATLGFSVITFLMISVELARVGQVAGWLAQLPEVRAVHLTTGDCHIMVEAWLADSDDLLRFMSQQLGPIPGVVRTATCCVLRTVKDASEWILPVPQGLCVQEAHDLL